MYGIQRIQQFHIIVHPRCVNFLTEISLYCFDVDKKTGKTINKPIDDYNHLMDALRYSILELLYRSGGNTSVVVGANETNLLNEPKLSYEQDENAPKRKSRVFSS